MKPGLLIDTHIWLWYAQGHTRITPSTLAAMESAIDTATLRISVMSIWEISLLEAAERIHLGLPVEAWIDNALALPGLKTIALETPIIVDAHRLPGLFHKDPVDRLLVASARHYEILLLTEDDKILQYARQGYVRACSISDMETVQA